MTLTRCYPTKTLDRWLAGELRPVEASRIGRHVEWCIPCRAYVVGRERKQAPPPPRSLDTSDHYEDMFAGWWDAPWR